MGLSVVSICRKGGVWAWMLALALVANVTLAANSDILGAWDAQMDFNGNKVPAKLKFEEKEGKLAGSWSGRQGDSPLSDVKYEAGKLTFKRHVNYQGQEFDLDFKGDVKDGKISGNFTTPMGDMPVTASRGGDAKAGDAKPAAGGEKKDAAMKKDEGEPTGAINLPGAWHMVVSVTDGSTSEGELTFTEKDGKMTAEWVTDLGTAKFPEVKVEGNKISFNANVDLGGTPVPLSFKGVSGGDKIKGTVSLTMDGQAMEMPTVGTKGPKGAAKAAKGEKAMEPLTGKVDLPGKWEVEVKLPDGNTSLSTFTIEEKGGKLSGKLDTEIGSAKIDEIKVEGNKISYKTSIDMAGTPAPLEFAGTTGGEKMNGTVKLAMEGQPMELPATGKKAAMELTGAVNLPGSWDVEATLPDGNTSNTTMVLELKDGKIVGKMSTEIGDGKIEEVKVEGNKFSFKCAIDMQGTPAPLEVSGSTGGDKLIGKAKLNMEGQAMEIGLKGSRGAAKPAAAAGEKKAEAKK